MNAGRGDRLRHQLDSAADRRCASTGNCATCTARCASCGSARASTRPADSRRTRWSAPAPRWSTTPLCARRTVSTVRMVATSATRDAGNRDVFFAMTADVLGAVVDGSVAEVITGAEEAELSFRGAVNELDSAAAPFVIVDLGGGSTEVVLGTDTVVGELLGRHRLRAADRALSALGSADGRRGGGRPRGGSRTARRGAARRPGGTGPDLGGRGRHDDDDRRARTGHDDL